MNKDIVQIQYYFYQAFKHHADTDKHGEQREAVN